MSTVTLPRVALWEIYYASQTATSRGVNDGIYCSGRNKTMAQAKYDLSALQTERAGRTLIIKRVTVGWYTSAKYTYNIRIQPWRTFTRKMGYYLGDAKGTSISSMQPISTTRYAGNDTVAIMQGVINDGASEIYVSCENAGEPSGRGECQYFALTIEYEYATPLNVIEYLTADKDRIVLGESVDISASIRNITQSEISAVQLQVVREVDGADVAVGDAVTVDATIPAAETALINQTLTIPVWADAARATQLYVQVTIVGADAEKEALCMALDRRYNPTIEAFNVSRATEHPINGWMKSDNGVNTMTDMKIGLDSGATGFTLKVYYGTGVVDISTAESIDLTSRISDAITGFIDDTGIIERTGGWSLGSAWNFLLVLSDGYESAQMAAEIRIAFTNMHLAGLTTGGVRFGGYCTRSEQDSPAFECSYPIYADGGIASLDYSTEEMKMPYKWIDGKQIYRKVVQVGAIAAGQYTSYDFMPTSEIGDIVSVRGTACADDGNTWLPIPVASHWSDGVNLYAINIAINCSSETANITVAMGSSRSITRGFVVIDYTKGA